MEIEEERVGKEEIWGIRRRINGSNLWSELLQVMNMAVVAYLYFLFAVYVFLAYQDCLCFFVTNLNLICIVQNAVYDQVIKYFEISNLKSIDLHTFFHLKKSCGYAG